MNEPSLLKRILRRVALPPDSARSAQRKAKSAVSLCHDLMSSRGEVSGAAIAREALAAYQQLPENAFAPFVSLLAAEFSPDPAAVVTASTIYHVQPNAAHLIALQRAVEAPRQELFRRLNMAPAATAVLVDLRRRILREIDMHPEWMAVEADLSHLLASWFNRGFLRLERIDWHTPAIVLERLIEYEAVHEITGWEDLRRRLAADRRCFAFFHPALPDDPLIFIEVALTTGVSTSVQPLLDPDRKITDASRADCAMFYSITNCQEGLRGISFGNLLIKQVVNELSRESGSVKTFATLSPVTGFMKWLKNAMDEIEVLPNGAKFVESLGLLKQPDWHRDAGIAGTLGELLMPLCAHYLNEIKKDGEPLDAVARFHLGNGARLAQLNWLADTSRQGMQRSAGMMVNYLYRLDDVESNHQAYAEGRVIASHTVTRLAKKCILRNSSFHNSQSKQV